MNSEWRKERDKVRRDNFFASIIVLTFLLSIIPAHASYNKETYKWDMLYEKGGCVVNYDCPEEFNHPTIADFPKYSKGWWNLYCEGVKGTFLECR